MEKRVHMINGDKIVAYPTHVSYHPSTDWTATSDNYDASFEDGCWVASHPVGFGPTEEAAIKDYMEQLDD